MLGMVIGVGGAVLLVGLVGVDMLAGPARVATVDIVTDAVVAVDAVALGIDTEAGPVRGTGRGGARGRGGLGSGGNVKGTTPLPAAGPRP